MHGLRQTLHRLRHRFNAPMVLLGDEAQVEAPYSRLEIVLFLMQDRCMVYAERTICSEVVLDTPDRTAR